MTQTVSRQVRRQLERLGKSPWRQGLGAPAPATFRTNRKAHRAFYGTKLYAPNGDREVARRSAS